MFMRLPFVQDKWACDREIKIRRRSLATGSETGRVNFVPIDLSHNSLIVADVDVDVPVRQVASPRSSRSLAHIEVELDRNVSH